MVDGVNAESFRLEGEWRYSQGKLDEFVASGAEIVISKIPFRPNYISNSRRQKKTSNLLSYRVNGVPTNEDATEEMRDLFGADVLSYPKPVGLLTYLLRATTRETDIVMDFFAGSGSLGAAVLHQNQLDGGRRRFVLVQIPELLDPANKEQRPGAEFCDAINRPRNIAELTKERLRREAARIQESYPRYAGDLGFRVFRLESRSDCRIPDEKTDAGSEANEA